jgi:hypothetical protein
VALAVFGPGGRLLTAGDLTVRLWQINDEERPAGDAADAALWLVGAAFAADGRAHRHRTRGRHGPGLGRDDRRAAGAPLSHNGYRVWNATFSPDGRAWSPRATT